MRRCRDRTGFTRTELLVVVGIAAVVAGMLLPALQKARAAAPRAACADNLRQIGQAVHGYADANGGELPYGHRNKSPLSGWATLLLPYLGEGDLHRQYRFDLDWYDPAQQAVVSRRVKVLQCPAAPDPDRTVTGTVNGVRYAVPPADYAAVSGITVDVVPAVFPPSYPRFGAMPVDETLRFADILDGPSNTLLVAEGAGRPQVWLAGRATGKFPPNDKSTWSAWNGNFIRGYSADGQVMPGPCGVNCSNNNAVYGFHQGGAFGLLGDGSVRFLKRDMDVYVLYALATRAGGEILAPGDY
jgi:type II secretory pathway pseudopilin PulG